NNVPRLDGQRRPVGHAKRASAFDDQMVGNDSGRAGGETLRYFRAGRSLHRPWSSQLRVEEGGPAKADSAQDLGECIHAELDVSPRACNAAGPGACGQGGRSINASGMPIKTPRPYAASSPLILTQVERPPMDATNSSTSMEKRKMKTASKATIAK